jgi:hypothetical protein
MKTMRCALAGAVLATLFASPASGRVVNVARRVRIAQTTRTFSVNVGDFNRDRRDDFFLVRHNPDNPPQSIPTSILYAGTRRKRFRVHAKVMFGRTDKHDCAWGRANRDRRPDLFCAIGLTQRSENELWIQRRNGRFVNRAQRKGLHFRTHGRFRTATFIHANRDRRPDIYVTRYAGSCFCDRDGDGEIDSEGDRWPNELWINEGRRFRKAPEFGLNKPISSKKDNASCTQAVDYDRDRDQDLLVCAARLHLYRNRNGRGFVDVTRRKKLGVVVADARFVRLNGDRRYDFVRLTTQRLTVRYGRRRGRLGPSRLIARVSGGIGLAFGRFNRGTRTDIYMLAGRTRRDAPDKIYLQKRRRFRALTIPAVRRGIGDDVAALDYNRDGRTDFVVTNGDRKKAGPVQLWTWRRG